MRSGFVLGGLVRGKCGKALVAPLRQRSDAFGGGLTRPGRDHPVDIRTLGNLGSSGCGSKLL